MVRLARKSLWSSGQGAGDVGWAEVDRIAGEIALIAGAGRGKSGSVSRAGAYSRASSAGKSWERRAAMSMARLWRDQWKPQQAREVLAPVYGWFTEGFDKARSERGQGAAGHAIAATRCSSHFKGCDMTPLPGAANPLVGTWKLVSFQFEAEGSNERLDVYDEHPVGFIIFTADWRVLALVTASERADDETARALFDRMMAYSGRYRMRVDGCFITIVDSAWYPAWIGTEQTNFFTLNGDTLSIISPLLQHPKFPNDRVRGVAIWRKE
jgi:hypothetical protein